MYLSLCFNQSIIPQIGDGNEVWYGVTENA